MSEPEIVAELFKLYQGLVNLAGYIALGAYPYLRNGISGCQDWHYEKAGLRYYFSRIGNTFVGFAIKAHNFRAENFEFTVGVKMG